MEKHDHYGNPLPTMYFINWVDKDGLTHGDYFCTEARAKRTWGNMYGEISCVHTWIDPKQGLLSFLHDLPLDDVKIYTIPS